LFASGDLKKFADVSRDFLFTHKSLPGGRIERVFRSKVPVEQLGSFQAYRLGIERLGVLD
jgi:hypothetical protein